jgi:flagellin-like hook-associated protein FlgL
VPGISAALPAITATTDSLGQLLGETGAAVNQYETIRTQLANATLDTKSRRSLLYDIDLTDASANFAQAQTAYQAALSAANRVLNLNVLDYLR